MTREEYEKTYIRMMDSIRSDNYFKGHSNCESVPCERCPLNHICMRESLLFSAPAIMEVVEKWGKEHPIITRADKFKEVFGRIPKTTERSAYFCPKRLGFDMGDCHERYCVECAKEFWESEYIEPKKDGGTE